MPRSTAARVYPEREVPVTRHRALWSSDFPPPTCVESDPPPFQGRGQSKAQPFQGQGTITSEAASFRLAVPPNFFDQLI